MGHWLGLLHTFAGGCDSSTGGDWVSDTRAGGSAVYDCTPSINTCPSLAGTDPINNFMGAPATPAKQCDSCSNITVLYA